MASHPGVLTRRRPHRRWTCAAPSTSVTSWASQWTLGFPSSMTTVRPTIEGLGVAVHACHSGLLPSSLVETLDCWADAPVLGRRSGESYPIRPTFTSSCPRSRKHSSSSYCDWEYIGTWEFNLTGSAIAWHSRGPGDGRSLYLKLRSDTKGRTLHVKFERASASPPNGSLPTADAHPPALTAPPGCQGSGRELFLRSDECTPEYAGTGYGPKTAAGAFSKMQ